MTGDVYGYWKYDPTGATAPVVRKYLEIKALTPDELKIMRGYLEQWIYLPGFRGHDINDLRATVGSIVDEDSLTAWIWRAVDAGADPL